MRTKVKKAAAYALAVVLGVTAAILMTASFSVVTIKSQAMSPAVDVGDKVLINKWAYIFDEPQIGDLVAFHCNVYSEEGEGSTLIRRVAATEGDLVEIKDGSLYINNELYDNGASGSAYMEPMEKIAVGPGKVFVLNDNRASLLDSRDQAVGQLSTAEATGGVLGKIDGKKNE